MPSQSSVHVWQISANSKLQVRSSQDDVDIERASATQTGTDFDFYTTKICQFGSILPNYFSEK